MNFKKCALLILAIQQVLKHQWLHLNGSKKVTIWIKFWLSLIMLWKHIPTPLLRQKTIILGKFFPIDCKPQSRLCGKTLLMQKQNQLVSLSCRMILTFLWYHKSQLEKTSQMLLGGGLKNL